jgi:hypothetical protein
MATRPPSDGGTEILSQSARISALSVSRMGNSTACSDRSSE